MDETKKRARWAAAARARRQDPAVRAREAAAKRVRRLAAPETVRAYDAARQRAHRAADPERRAREAAAQRARRLADLDAARERGAAAQRRYRSRIRGADAQCERREFLALKLGRSCDVIGAARNTQPTCVNCMLRDGTLRRRPRRCYDKCMGKDDMLPEHANHSSQTEQHITLVWCPRQDTSTRNVEVQVDLL
ncbi:uncharacterized protein LOC119179990 isoform X2 [Rhipicephalus microplus]|uniref:uncharacterized protein LOC119179990 isoform X2 n=1 Tax=Rhipicephalus microplus TaxID=6941 RepID=UPI003F6A830D